MNKPLRILCVLLPMLAVIGVAGFIACGGESSEKDPSTAATTPESSKSETITTRTNPNDDGFGSEIGM